MKNLIVWLTGLSGSGKTTIAINLERKLVSESHKVKILDADEIRLTTHKNLGFSTEDITKNNLGVAELALTQSREYDFVIVPIISPIKDVRERIKLSIGKNFIEVYLKCSLEKLIHRDTKGLYKKAINQELNNLIGFPRSEVRYEEPENPNLILYTDKNSVKKCTNELYSYLLSLN